MPSALAAVFVTPPEQSPVWLGVRAATRTFGLTDAETRLLTRLASGLTIVEAAERLDITEPTARTHLAHIFSKCGVSRQADLVRLVLNLAAPVKSA
jgi:DNA-binding CsgD family transcriptional regulator